MLATLRADFARIPDLLAKPAPEQPAPEPEPEPEPVIEAPELMLVHDEQLGLF
jgi:hypothetical protein